MKSRLLRRRTRNRYRRKKLLYRPRGNDMTYIMGARCKDGVVLVGDTKVTIDEGAHFAHDKKIKMPLNGVVMGSSGIGGLYMEFQNRIRSAVLGIQRRAAENSNENNISDIATPEGFSVLVSKVIRNMHDDYGDDRHLIIRELMIISAMRIGSPEAQLTVFTPWGYPEPVNEKRAIGHGEPYGAIFLEKMWNKNMSMEQATKLGIFIIKFIQDMKLDNSVGYDQEFLPQVFHIPNIQIPEKFEETLSKCKTQEEIDKAWAPLLFEKYAIRELPNEEVQYFINEISSKVFDFENLFKRGKFKI